jgi:hypothetical protein
VIVCSPALEVAIEFVQRVCQLYEHVAQMATGEMPALIWGVPVQKLIQTLGVLFRLQFSVMTAWESD